MPPNAAESLLALLPPLMKAYEVLFLVARHFHPPRFVQLMEQVGQPEEDLKSVLAQNADALASLGDLGRIVQTASDEALRAYEILRQLQGGAGDLTVAFKAFRHLPLGLEALYALAGVLPPVNRFFLDPKLRSDEVPSRWCNSTAIRLVRFDTGSALDASEAKSTGIAASTKGSRPSRRASRRYSGVRSTIAASRLHTVVGRRWPDCLCFSRCG